MHDPDQSFRPDFLCALCETSAHSAVKSSSYLLEVVSSAVVTVTIDPRLTSSFKLSGGTRRVIESSLIEKIVPFRPPLVTTLSPVLSAPSIACHFFCRRCWGRI